MLKFAVVLLLGSWLVICPTSAKSKKENRDRPRNVTLGAIDSMKLQVHWLPPRSQPRCPVSRYIIRIKDDKDSESEAERADGNATSHTISGLKPDTRYYVRLVAVGCRGKSVPTRWAKTKTMPADGSTDHDFMGDEKISRVEDRVPGKPSEVRTRTLTDSIILSWAPPNDNALVRGYMVGYGEGVPDVNWQYVAANTKTFTIRNLKPSTQYVISLRAFNNFGKGPVVYDLIYTREEDAGPTPGPLAPPIGLTSKVLSASTVWLQWQDPSLGRSQKVTDDRYYIITYSAQPKGKIQSLTVKAMNVVVYNLSPGTTYEFRVKTRKQNAETTYSISTYNTTMESVPSSPPRMFEAHPTNGSTTVLMTWQPPEQPNGVITGYLIFYTSRRTSQERDWIIEGVLGDRFQVTVRQLDPDTTYYFKIQARNSKGYGPTSDTISYRTPADKSADLHYLVTSSPMPAIYSEIDPEADPAAEHVRFTQEVDQEEGEEEEEETAAEAEEEEEDGPEEEDAGDLEDEDDDVVYQPEETDKPYALRQVDGAEESLSDESKRKEFEMTSPKVTYSDASAVSLKAVPKVSFHTLVKHKVSAVLAWNDEEDNADFSHYHLSYYEENDVNTKESVTSQIPVFAVDNLKPQRLYLYEVRKESNSNAILWRRSGTIDTSVKNSEA